MAIYTILCALFFVSTVHAGWQIHVDAGEHDRIATVFTAALPEDFPEFQHGAVVVDAVTKKSVAFQADTRRKAVYWIDSIPAGNERTYSVRFLGPNGRTESTRLAPSSAPSFVPSLAAYVKDDGESLVLGSGKATVEYQYETMLSPDPEKPFHARSGFLRGIRAPSGRLVTDPMPSDHLHQHGVMFAWRSTEFENRKVNFWEDAAQEGQISHYETVSKNSGPVFAEIDVRLKHVDTTAPGGSKEVLSENWRIRVYRQSATANETTARELVWDFDSIQKNVSGSPLKMRKFNYGGLMIRGAADWINGPHRMLTSNGDSQQTGNHTRPLWVDINGVVDGQHVGLTTMGHPGNFRFPQSVRLHPKMPYYCFAPMVDGPFEIGPGETFSSRFRFVAHDGPLDRGLAVAYWRDWSSPPTVTISQVDAP